MRAFTLIAKEKNNKNPFIIETLSSLPKVMGENFYIIESAEKAFEYFPNFKFTQSKINDKVYWVDSLDVVDDLIMDILSDECKDVEVVYDIRNLKVGNTLYYYKVMYNIYYLLTDDKIYHVDFNIINKLEQQPFDISFFQTNLVSFDDIKVPMKELRLLDELYSYKSFNSYLNKYNKHYVILLFMQDVFRNSFDIKPVYNIDNKYNNPYQNILDVETYLNNVEVNTIDVKKCIDYDLKVDKLPARYNYSGFYTTTGRIFSSSDNFSPLQTIAKAKRDILFAEDNCYLIEIDYKSFEVDILCQVLGISHSADPHTDIYNRLVGIEGDFDLNRTIGKTINYAFIYGMDENRLADKVITDLKIQDRNFKDKFLEKLSEEKIMILSKELSNKLEEEMDEDNIIKNYFGRSIHCKKSFAALNNYISSTAADFLYNKMVQIIELLSGRDKIILQNHDSILFQLTNDTLNNTDTFENILSIMESPISGLKGRISYTYGKNWKTLS